MCLGSKHLDYLERTNEADFREKRVSYIDRCRCCDLCDNGEHGDILGECRIHLLRLFISMKRDAERRLNEKAAAKASTGSGESGTG